MKILSKLIIASLSAALFLVVSCSTQKPAEFTESETTESKFESIVSDDTSSDPFSKVDDESSYYHESGSLTESGKTETKISSSNDRPFPTITPTITPAITKSPATTPTVTPTPTRKYNLMKSDYIMDADAWTTPYLRPEKGFEFEVEITSLGTSYVREIVEKTIRNLQLGTYEPMRGPGSAYEWGYSFTHLDGHIDGGGNVIEAGYPTPPQNRQEALDVIEEFIFRQYLSNGVWNVSGEAVVFWMKVEDLSPPYNGKTQLQVMISETNPNNPGHMGAVYFSNWKSFDYYTIDVNGTVNSDNNEYIAVPGDFVGYVAIPFSAFENHPAYPDPDGKFDPEKLFSVSFDLHSSTPGSSYYFDDIGIVKDLSCFLNSDNPYDCVYVGQNFNNVTNQQIDNFVFPLGPGAVKSIVEGKNEPGGRSLMLQSASGTQIHEAVKLYFESLGERTPRPWKSKNGHYMWHHYAGEFGFDVLASEVGENINSYQMSLAFNRGAAKQYSVPWAIDFSAWHGPSITDYSSGKIWGDYSGPDHGHSMSLLERTYFMSYMSGAPYIIAEAGGAISFYDSLDKNGNYILSPYGEVGKRFYDFTVKHPDVGITYTPFAIVLDYYHGVYPGFGNRLAFHHFPYNAGDNMTWSVMDLFFPGGWEVMGKQEVGTLVNGPYGDTCDVLLQNASQKVLNSYPALIFSGDISFSKAEIERYISYVRQGGTILMNTAYLDYFPDYRASYNGQNRDEIIDGKGRVIVYGPDYSIQNLDPIIRGKLDQLMPFQVSENIQHIVSIKNGSIYMTLINNDGVTKNYRTPPVVDKSKTKTIDVTYTGDLKIKSVKDIYNDRNLNLAEGKKITVTIGPGELTVIEFAFD